MAVRTRVISRYKGLAVVAAVVLVAAGCDARVTSPAPGEAYTVCVRIPAGQARIVADASKCKNGETPLQLVNGAKEGPKGDRGPTGPTGDKGDVGAAGRQGVKGDQGVDGKDGRDGADGPPGQQGVKGDQGVDGKDGRDGADGPRGPQGDKGDKGDVGDQGPQGPQGQQGPGALQSSDLMAFTVGAPEQYTTTLNVPSSKMGYISYKFINGDSDAVFCTLQTIPYNSYAFWGMSGSLTANLPVQMGGDVTDTVPFFASASANFRIKVICDPGSGGVSGAVMVTLF